MIRSSVNGGPYTEVLFCLDCSKTLGLKANRRARTAWGSAYQCFRSTPGAENFLHSVYLNSALFCDMSRQL